MAGHTKLPERLGTRHSVPVEMAPFGLQPGAFARIAGMRTR